MYLIFLISFFYNYIIFLYFYITFYYYNYNINKNNLINYYTLLNNRIKFDYKIGLF
jgi:hypothetical protein